jgi:hypothetical protein
MSTRLPAVTVVGSINLDIIATTDRLPTAGETIGGGVLQQQPGGKGANQAVAAARLGGSARMIGAVGDDAQGRLMLEALSAAGVDTSDVAVLDGDATGTALIVVDRDGENQIVVCPGANAAFSLGGRGVWAGRDGAVPARGRPARGAGGGPEVLRVLRAERGAGHGPAGGAAGALRPGDRQRDRVRADPGAGRGEARGGDVREGRLGDVRARPEGGRGSCCCSDGGEHDRCGRCVLRGAGAGAAERA